MVPHGYDTGAARPTAVPPHTRPGSDDDSDVEHEHQRRSTCCSSLNDIKGEYGRGVYVYFLFLRFLAAANAVMALCALAGFAVASEEHIVSDELATLFLSSYPRSARVVWTITTVIMIGVSFATGPLYRKYQRRVTAKWTGTDREEEIERDDDIVEYDSNHARVTISSASRRNRQVASLFAFACVIGAQGFLTWYLHVLLKDTTDSIVAQVIAVSLTLLNVIWKNVGKALTKFEKHKTWTGYREFDCGKVFVLKLCNVLVLYVVKAVVAADASGEQGCLLRAMGFQFFWLIFYEITLNNVIELGIPFAMLHVSKRLNKAKGGDNASKPKFDLAEEYVEVLYRQFIIFLGMPVFPLITLLAVVSYALEWWLDKARLVYICQKPSKHEEPLRETLVFAFSLCAALAGLASFPNGSAFVLGGYDMEHCDLFV